MYNLAPTITLIQSPVVTFFYLASNFVCSKVVDFWRAGEERQILFELSVKHFAKHFVPTWYHLIPGAVL